MNSIFFSVAKHFVFCFNFFFLVDEQKDEDHDEDERHLEESECSDELVVKEASCFL